MTGSSKIEQKGDTQGEHTSSRQERIERREERRAARRAGALGWIAGLILIVIGALYLLQDFGILPEFTNWWALFMLLPAVGTLSAALGGYRRNGGHWTPEVTAPFLAGLLFLDITAVFLFNLNYDWLWPLFLIAAGLFLLAAPMLSRNR